MEKPTIRDDGQGENLSVAGNAYRIIISGKETGGEYAIIEMVVPPEGGPGSHAHPEIQEAFYVIEGEITFKTDEGNHIGAKGSYVNIPKGGLVHQFKNKTNNAARMLCIVTPSGLEEMFKEIGKPIEPGIIAGDAVSDAGELERLKQVAEKYGQKLYPPDYFDKKL